MKNKNTLNKNEIQKVDWEKIQLEMKNKFGKDIFESWLRKINFSGEFNDYILLSVSTRFLRDWITSRYLDQILQIVKSHKNEINRIEISIADNDKEDINDNDKNIINSSSSNNNVSFIKDFFFQYNRIDPNKKFISYAGWNSKFSNPIPLPFQRNVIGQYCDKHSIKINDYQFENEYVDWLPGLEKFITGYGIDAIVCCSIYCLPDDVERRQELLQLALDNNVTKSNLGFGKNSHLLIKNKMENKQITKINFLSNRK